MYQKQEQPVGKKVRSFLKWVGSKSRSMFKIYRNYPRQKFTKYCEPFLGSGIVMLDVLANHELDTVVGNDANQELILTWEQIRDNVEEVIEKLKGLEDRYLGYETSQEKIRMYKEISRKYNEAISNKAGDYEDSDIATMFIFLNKTCSKGLYRVTSNGEYNSPWDDAGSPRQICESDLLRDISKAIKNVKFSAIGFKNCIKNVDENTFVFLDPPYVNTNPEPKSESLFKLPSYPYVKKPFTPDDFYDVLGFMNAASDKGASVLLVIPYKKEEEKMIAEMFVGYRIKQIDYRKENGEISYSELFISNY